MLIYHIPRQTISSEIYSLFHVYFLCTQFIPQISGTLTAGVNTKVSSWKLIIEKYLSAGNSLPMLGKKLALQ